MRLPAHSQELVERLAERGAQLGPVPVGSEGDQALVWEAGALRALPWSEIETLPLDLAPLLDHTLLRAGVTAAEIETLCAEARAHGFASVCVNPAWVPLAAERLGGSPVRVCTVVGFPLGATSTAAKAYEAAQALRDGAHEVDMVLDLGAARSGDWGRVEADLRSLRAAVPPPRVLKVILETCLLADAEKAQACRLASEAGLNFVKTSTGFSTGGATEADVALMRREAAPEVGVKASGGIRTRDQALAMVKAGATRLGVSASLAIVGTAPAQSPGNY